MRCYTSGLCIIVVVGLAGCSGERVVPVSGTVKTKAGKPVTDVLLVLLPAEGPMSTKTRAFPLDNQGAFQGEAVTGTYTFYLSRLSVETDEDGKPVNRADVKKQKANELAFAKVPKAYRTHEGAGPERKVELTSSGSSLNLEVAP